MRRNPIYWGKAGAGILFFDKTRSKVLLTLRSKHVEQPLTWGVVGGAVAVEELVHSKEAGDVSYPIDQIKETALKEAREELGPLPKNLSFFDIVEYRDGGFTYTTFLVSIKMKPENWYIELDWENDEYDWFDVRDLPKPLHFGVQYLVEQKPEYFN
jgi:8-oxo-dGTP pyrophosphatase MutT (NUDIX family)